MEDRTVLAERDGWYTRDGGATHFKLSEPRTISEGTAKLLDSDIRLKVSTPIKDGRTRRRQGTIHSEEFLAYDHELGYSGLVAHGITVEAAEALVFAWNFYQDNKDNPLVHCID